MSQTAPALVMEDLLALGTPEAVRRVYLTLPERARRYDPGLLGDDVVVLDTETTGLSFRDCELIEIAAARLEGGRIVDEFQTFVHPASPIPAQITELTGITGGDVVDAPWAPEAVAALADFVGGAPVVAHNATFDRTFIEKVKGGAEVSDLWIDSLALSRIALPRLTSHKLQDLAEVLGCAPVSHRAMDDVHALAGVWGALLCALEDLPDGLLERLAQSHPEVTWPFRPVFAYLSQRRGHQEFDLASVRRDLLAQAPTTPRRDMRGLGSDVRPVGVAAVARAFQKDGIVASLYEGFEPRVGQQVMAEAVTRSLDTSSYLAVEAPTGVGKSMGYLLPLALFARANGTTCGVATKTNALTDQLVSHELPALARALPGLSFINLKGYDHYPCLRKVARALDVELPDDLVQANGRSANTVRSDMLTALAVTLAAVCQSPEGDLDTLGIRWGSVPRTMLTTTSQECLRHRCPFYNEGCLLHGARRRAAGADIVVTNHSLLLRDVESEGRILPPIRHWMVDEAHSFDKEARRQWALEASAQGLRDAFEQLGGTKTGFVHRLMTDVAGTEAGEMPGRLLTKTAASLSRAQVASADFFDAVYQVAMAHRGQSGYADVALWAGPELRQSPEWAAMAERGVALADRLEEAVRFGREAQDAVKEALANPSGDLDRPLRELAQAQEALRTVIGGTDDAYVCSLEASLGKGRRGHERLVAEMLDVGQALAERWYPETETVGYCSATIAVGDDFTHFNQSVGLDRVPSDRVQELRLESEYRFDDAMAVLLPQDLPDPYAKNYLPALADMLYDVHVAMEGSVLTLFTNRRDMERVHALLAPRLEERGLTLRQQERRANVARLRRQFVEEKGSSLLALKSFWEGFDAPGDTLRCVVIPKLPFANPNDPLVMERELRDKRSWWRHSLPEAVLEVKQAAGRLIRSSQDQGVLILADNRLHTKRYGRQFIASLPSQNVTGLSWRNVGRFLDMWRGARKGR